MLNLAIELIWLMEVSRLLILISLALMLWLLLDSCCPFSTRGWGADLNPGYTFQPSPTNAELLLWISPSVDLQTWVLILLQYVLVLANYGIWRQVFVVSILYTIADEYNWYQTQRLLYILAMINNALVNMLPQLIKTTNTRSGLILSHTVDTVNKKELKKTAIGLSIENKCQWYSATNGHVTHPKTQGPLKGRQKDCESWKLGRTTEKEHLLDMTGLWTHGLTAAVVAHIRPSQSTSCNRGGGSWAPKP